MKFTLVSALGILSASGALALPKPHATGPHKVSLAKGNSLTHSNGSVKVNHILASVANTLAKFQGIKSHLHDEPVAQHDAERTAGRRREAAHPPANVPLTDHYKPALPKDLDIAYSGPVTIGSNDGNAQEFQLLFDTGSYDIWVPNSACGALQGCSNSSTKYDQGGTALHETADLKYLDGTASGEFYTDDVTVGGLRLFDQKILSANSTASSSSLGPIDGIAGMGLGIVAFGQGPRGPTFFENLILSGAVEEHEFSFYLGRAASGTANDSELTLGGRDSTKYYQHFTTVPVDPILAFWQVKLDNVMVSGRPAGPHSAGKRAIIDTGTTAIRAPLAAAEEIMSQIPGSMPIPIPGSDSEGDVYYMYPCNTHVRHIPSLTFAGTSFNINPLDFNIGFLADDYCLAGIIGTKDMEVFVVGDVFMKNWYTVFSYSANHGKPAVLFAPSIGRLQG